LCGCMITKNHNKKNEWCKYFFHNGSSWIFTGSKSITLLSGTLIIGVENR
jgi:hypothetical protein